MKFIPLILITALTFINLIFLTSPASAQEPVVSSGNWIVDGCNALNDSTLKADDVSIQARAWTCAGACVATYDLEMIHGNICPPSGITKGQVLRVVTKYLNDHPAILQTEYPILMARALKEAWPCATK